MARKLCIAAIPGDGIGAEVIGAGLEVLAALAETDSFGIEAITFDWGSARYHRTGPLMTEDGVETPRGCDAILSGAAGAPDVPDHLSLCGLRLAIRQGLDQHTNPRPVRSLPGIESPLQGVDAGDLDRVIVRDNAEGEYAGQGGCGHRG